VAFLHPDGYARRVRKVEVLLHGGTHVGGWTAKQIHVAVLTTFALPEKRYGLNHVRYNLRKLKGHDLLERDGSHYAYRLATKGVEFASVPLLPQTPVRPSRQQPLPQSADRRTSPRKPPRGRLPSRRCGDTDGRRFARRRLTRRP